MTWILVAYVNFLFYLQRKLLVGYVLPCCILYKPFKSTTTEGKNELMLLPCCILYKSFKSNTTDGKNELMLSRDYHVEISNTFVQLIISQLTGFLL